MIHVTSDGEKNRCILNRMAKTFFPLVGNQVVHKQDKCELTGLQFGCN